MTINTQKNEADVRSLSEMLWRMEHPQSISCQVIRDHLSRWPDPLSSVTQSHPSALRVSVLGSMILGALLHVLQALNEV